MQHVFIIGSKGIPARYGGFETFVDKLIQYQQNKDIKYHVACQSKSKKEYEYHRATCFNIYVPNIGPGKAVYYDIVALKTCLKFIRKNHIDNPTIYILACRIGPFISHYVKQLKKLNGHLFVNPDGHEWKRDKWNVLIKKYWKLSEKFMVKHSEFLICDSKNIEKYIVENYKKYDPSTCFIAYGADTTRSELKDLDEIIVSWYKEQVVHKKEYYLVVGRFVPENNFETIITEFMKSSTKKDLVIISNVEQNNYYNKLRKHTNFDTDSRIKFVGTVYHQELLKKIRENSYAYIHGHEVGGTNPSLLEAMALTKVNILLDVSFNREVGMEGTLFWNKRVNNLSNLINEVEMFSSNCINELGDMATSIIHQYYNWNKIIDEYESLFQRIVRDI